MDFSRHEGLGYHSSPEFTEVLEHLRTVSKQTFEASFPTIAQQLLKCLKESPGAFFESVCLTRNGRNKYYQVPIFRTVSPNEFANVIIQADPAHLVSVWSAFRARYNGATANELKVELPWLLALRLALLNQTFHRKFDRFRIEWFVEAFLNPNLLDWASHGWLRVSSDPLK